MGEVLSYGRSKSCGRSQAHLLLESGEQGFFTVHLRRRVLLFRRILIEIPSSRVDESLRVN